MDIREIKKRIKKNEIAPLYVLYGTQKFLIDELIQEISKKILQEDSIDFNYERYDLNEQPIELAIQAAQTFPFIGEKRLIVASEALFLTGAKTQNKIEHDLTSLEAYVESVADFSVLILVVHQDKLDERKKVVKLLKQHAVLCSCSSLQSDALVPWIIDRGREHHVRVDEDAAAMLIQFVGEDMQLLTKEIEKMALYVGRENTITPPIVQEMVSKSIEHDVFSLVEHVVQYRMAEAMNILHDLMKKNEEPIKIIILLARQFRMIYKAKVLYKQGYSPNQMAQLIGVHPYVCKLVLEQGRPYSEEQLLAIIDFLAETDYLMKVGQVDKVLALEMFLLRLNVNESFSV